MTKEEYLKLYEEWTMCDDVAKSKEICDKLASAVVDELQLIDEVYSRYHMGYDSPLNQSSNYIVLSDVDRVRLMSMSSCEVKLSLHTPYSAQWSDVLLNIKWFGEAGRKLSGAEHRAEQGRTAYLLLYRFRVLSPAALRKYQVQERACRASCTD